MTPIHFEDLGAHLRETPGDWNTDQAWERVHARIRPRRGLLLLRTAALMVITVGLGVIWHQLQVRRDLLPHAGLPTTFHTDVGQRASVVLVDGSTVELAPLSTLKVIDIGKKQRIVALEGEAFFDVHHDEKRPFTVRARESETRVLGTSFDVNAYSNDIEVIVATGRVQLRHARTLKGVILERNQAGMLHEETLSTRAVNSSEALAWRSGQLAFNDARLSDVATVLQRWYGVQISIADPVLAATRVTAYLPQQSLTEVLDVLAETLHARYQRTQNRITFTSK